MRPANTSTIRRWGFAGAALACALMAGRVALDLQHQAQVHDLRGSAGDAKVPPSIAILTKATGCFRAIFLTTLWIRATDLQDQGKFFELNDLFHLISQLEPRFPSIWAFWSWNVAYNCSVKFPADQAHERWRWVQLGISILRDDGIRINPKAAMLYRELAWIYNHKIGQDSDDAHIYYKVQVAKDTQDALGKPPYLGRLKAMAAAPRTERDLLRDPAVDTLVRKDLQAAGVDPFAKPLDVANRADTLPPKALELLNDPDRADAVTALEIYLRATYARNVMKMDPARMVKLMDFGSIDWRLPEAHSLYWTAISVELFGADVFAVANSDRMLFHSLAELYRRGQLRFEPGTEDEPAVWIVAPNFDLLPAVVKLQEEIVARHKNDEYTVPTLDGYLNFLRDAILNLWVHNDRKLAAEYYKRFLALGTEPERPLDDFVQSRYNDILKGMTTEQALNLIRGFLFRSLLWASLGDNGRAVGEEDLAKALYLRYTTQFLAPRIRQQIPPLRELWLDALRQAILTLRKFQVNELRRLYPADVKAIEAHLKRLEEEAKKRQGPPP